MDALLPNDQLNIYYDRFGLSLSELDMDGVELIPQTMAPFPWHFGGQRYQNLFVHAEQCEYWCKEFNLRMCFDISHSRLMSNHFGVDFYEFAEKLAPLTGHLHLGDALGVNGEGLQIGDGDIDFKKLGIILCCNHALLRTGITKSGRLAPVADVARAMGHAGQSPALPDWVAGWVGGDQARPWPPMQDGTSSP